MMQSAGGAMRTEGLFRQDAYLTDCTARVIEFIGEETVVLDRTVFFGGGGGQPCDVGWLAAEDGTGNRTEVRAASHGDGGAILHHLVGDTRGIGPGITVRARIDWERRHRLMRMHTALHLLSVALPFPVTGGAVGSHKSRLDFAMPEPPNRESLEADLHALVGADYPVGEEWIDEGELQERPELIKTVGARPPAGTGRVRLVRIGSEGESIDLQPCGGTHVRSTAEIGVLSLGKIEKKGRNNRRVNILI